VLEAAEAFRDVTRRRSGGVFALVALFEISSDLWPRSNCQHQLPQFVSKLPTRQFGEFSRHDA
jgi:hypothetical protein